MKKRFYLEGVNPLRGLDIPGLVRRIEQGELGYYSMLMWTYRAFEKKDPLVRAVKRLLLSSLGALKWDIKIPDNLDDDKKAIAERQQKDLRTAYDAIANLRPALNFLALAELRGFSHLEKVYAGAPNPRTGRPFNEDLDPWTVVELRPVEQWFWAKNGFYGPWLYNPEAREVNTGESIDLANYVIQTIDDPADEIFAEKGTQRRVNDADWDGFLEDYGVPAQFFAMPQNVPKDKETEYQAAAERALSRARGAVPFGTELLSPSGTGSGGAGVFSERLKYLDEQIVLAGTSGKLTVLTESGSGTLAGGAQKQVFDEIAQAIAESGSGVMQSQFDKPLLERLHKGEPVLAYFEFAAVDKEDTSKILEDAGKAKNAGFDMDEEEISEKTGYKLKRSVVVPPTGSVVERTAAPLVESPAKPNSGSQPSTPSSQPTVPPADPEKINNLFAAAVQQIAEADAADLEPLRRALESASVNPTPERVQELLSQLEAIQSQMGLRGAEVREKVFGTALATGLSS